MTDNHAHLGALQAAYAHAVEAWIAAIREEAALAAVAHNVAEIDAWEGAGFREEEARFRAKAAKKAYEDGLRVAHFDF